MLAGIISILAGFILLAGVLRSTSRAGKFAKALLPFQTLIGVAALVVGLINLLGNPVLGILLILGGLVLAVQVVDNIPGIGEALQAAGNFLAGIGVVLGVLLLVMGVVRLIQVAL